MFHRWIYQLCWISSASGRGRGLVMLVLVESSKKQPIWVKTETSVIHNAHDLFDACNEHLETKLKGDGSYIHFIQTFRFMNNTSYKAKNRQLDNCAWHMQVTQCYQFTRHSSNQFEIPSLLLHRMSEWFRLSKQFVSQTLARFQFANKEVCCT